MFNIKTDSRKVKKGDIFVALKEYSSDGHQFIEKAIEKGASKIVCEYGDYGVETLVVKDTHEYLKNYLNEQYSYLFEKLKIVGITGTNGKTTSAYMLHNALNSVGKKSAYIGTIGFYIKDKIKDLSNTTNYLCDTFELFYEAYNLDCEYVIMEVSSQGIAHRRVESLMFDYAIFTNLTQDHLDYHKTMDNYMKTKQELFKKVKKSGICFINNDDEYKDNFYIHSSNISYGFTNSDFQIIDYKTNSTGNLIRYKENEVLKEVQSKLIGLFNVYNIMVIVSFLSTIKIKDKIIKEVILTLDPPIGRMSLIKYKNNSIIIDYAHSPDSFEKVIDNVKDSYKNVYIVFGCTGDRDKTKRPIMFDIASTKSKFFIITNDDLHYEDPMDIVNDMTKNSKSTNYCICLDRKKAIIKGIKLLKDNDILLILGKGHETHMIVKAEKIPFSDFDEVNKYLKTMVENKS